MGLSHRAPLAVLAALNVRFFKLSGRKLTVTHHQEQPFATDRWQ